MRDVILSEAHLPLLKQKEYRNQKLKKSAFRAIQPATEGLNITPKN